MEFQRLRLLLKGKTGVFIGYLKTESMLLIKRFHRRYAAGSDNVFVQIASLWNIFMCLDTDLYGNDSAKERHVKENITLYNKGKHDELNMFNDGRRCQLKPNQIYILSAKYHLLKPEKIISPYNLTLNNLSATYRLY